MKKKFYQFLCWMIMALPLQSQGVWTAETSFPGPQRFQSAWFVIGDKLYMGLGSNDGGYLDDFWEYNTSNGQWTPKADFPGGARNSATGFSIGDKGYICFGSNTPGDDGWIWYKDVWQYDPVTDSWTRKNDFPGHERYLGIGFVINNKAFVGCGAYRFNRWTITDYYNDFWEYDPVADHWTERPAVPEEGRDAGFAMAIGDKGYFGFGFYYYDTRKKDWWQYDPVTYTWTRKADLPGEPRYLNAGFSINNKGYVGLGANYSPFNDLWQYNPETDQWVQKANFPGDARYAAVYFSVGNKGYMGMGVWTAYYNDLWQFTEEDSVFLTCPPDVTVYTRLDACSQWVTGIDPIFTPAGSNPSYSWKHIWRGSVIRTGTESLNNTTFPSGDNTLIYELNNHGLQTCSLRIHIVDTVTPTIIAPPTQQFCYNPSGNYTIPAMIFRDNCDLIYDISQGGFIGYSISGATNRSGLWPVASGPFNPGTSVITWLVRDAGGNEATAQTTVIVDPPLSVNIPNSYAVPLGDPNTVYIGYGPAGILLSAHPQGGTRYSDNSYRYSWSNGSASRYIWANPSVPGTYTYTVTITDSLGCTATDDITITVKDVRCGPQLNKVQVCINTRHGLREYCLKPFDAFLALLYGGKLGGCNELLTTTPGYANKSDKLFAEKSMQVFPNPGNGLFRLTLNNYAAGRYEISIVDINGKQVALRSVVINQPVYHAQFELSGLAKGVYIIKVSGKELLQTSKLVIQ